MPFMNPQESGKPVRIKDEGVLLTGAVGTIDFVGAGVTGTILGTEVTENIPGGTGAAYAYDEVLSGTGAAFTLAHTPNPAGSLLLQKNGQILTLTTDYSLVGANITLVVSKSADDSLIAKQYTY